MKSVKSLRDGLVVLLAAWTLALLAGCAAPAVPKGATGASFDCRRWLDRLDEEVEAHAVRDGGTARVAGAPYLRVDRLLASFVEEAAADDAAWHDWGRRAIALDTTARQAELRNLPDRALEPLGVIDRPQAMTRIRECAQSLWQTASADPEERARLLRTAQVPDDYSLTLRGLGLYPLSRWPFFSGVVRELDHWRSRWEAIVNEPPGTAGWLRYRPKDAGAMAGADQAIRRDWPRDALGIPVSDPVAEHELLARHAPVIEIETRSDHDRPGALKWGTSPSPVVDGRDPVVYQRVAHTRVGDQVLTQLVYSVWFSERPARGALDLLAGRVDAVVLRLTLDERGHVVLLDSIHGCGCYHVFVPSPLWSLRPSTDPDAEWAFVPARLPLLAEGARLRVRITATDHQLVGVSADDASGPVTGYDLRDEDSLRSLPTETGGFRSAFWSNGIMPGTERGERALFWPMGIESPGAMRQWGRHPTAFVGRRHFDDPRLVDHRFLMHGAPGKP